VNFAYELGLEGPVDVLSLVDTGVKVRTWSCVVPVVLPGREVRKKEKVPKIINSAPIMPLQKPVVTDVDYYNIDLSWTPASLPPDATPTSFKYAVQLLAFPFIRCVVCL